MNRSSSGSCTQPNVTEAIARETKSQGDQVARHPRLLSQGGSTGRRRHDLDQATHPEAPTSGSHHSNQEENKPTLRKQGPASRDLGSRNRKNKTFLNLNFRRVKAVTTGGTENGPKQEEKHDRDASADDQERKGTCAQS